MEKSKRPHVLVLPYPAQGHATPMLQFAKRLAFKGVKATFVSTQFVTESMHIDHSNDVINVEVIFDGHGDGLSKIDTSSQHLSSFETIASRTLAELVKKNADQIPVTALVYDGSFSWALDVAKHCGVLGVVFFTQMAAVTSVYYHVNRGLLEVPIPGPTVSLPGLPLLLADETPSFIGYHGTYPVIYEMVVAQFGNIDDVDWMLYNCFYEMEHKLIDWMGKKWKVGTVGPTIPSMYLDKRIKDDTGYGIHLFKSETSICINWLQNKPERSVVYVAFGSLADLGTEQMEEMAMGLKQSGCYFLWVVRATEESKLPKNLKEEAAATGKGLIVTWCPQLEVLAHQSIGCFISHCGFNSVMEALSLGVPVVAMAQWTDQTTNAKYVEDVWKIGVRVKLDKKGIVKREEIETCIKRVMEGEEGNAIKESSDKWKSLAREAIDEGGSSDKNIDEFVAKLVSTSNLLH